jgi:hypothetical protein
MTMSETGIKTVGEWGPQVENPLRYALAMSMTVLGKELVEACKHAIILMAQAARKMTPQSLRYRPVASDVWTHSEYVEVFRQNKPPTRIFKFMFGDPKRGGAGATMPGTWKDAQKIANRGLASRSWMWGPAQWLKQDSSKPIPGVTTIFAVNTGNYAGYILPDRIVYLEKIMPAGWKQAVETSAANKILWQVKNKIIGLYARTLNRNFRTGAGTGMGLSKFFLKAS